MYINTLNYQFAILCILNSVVSYSGDRKGHWASCLFRALCFIKNHRVTGFFHWVLKYTCVFKMMFIIKVYGSLFTILMAISDIVIQIFSKDKSYSLIKALNLRYRLDRFFVRSPIFSNDFSRRVCVITY